MNDSEKKVKREISAGGVVIKREDGKAKVLLIKDSYGRWTWPKGKLQLKESAEDAALREINEEIGLKNLEIIGKLENINYFYRLHGQLIYKTIHLFLIECVGKEELKIQKEEIQDAEWLAPAEAIKIIQYKGAKEILEKAINKFFIKNKFYN